MSIGLKRPWLCKPQVKRCFGHYANWSMTSTPLGVSRSTCRVSKPLITPENLTLIRWICSFPFKGGRELKVEIERGVVAWILKTLKPTQCLINPTQNNSVQQVHANENNQFCIHKTHTSQLQRMLCQKPPNWLWDSNLKPTTMCKWAFMKSNKYKMMRRHVFPTNTIRSSQVTSYDAPCQSD